MAGSGKELPREAYRNLVLDVTGRFESPVESAVVANLSESLNSHAARPDSRLNVEGGLSSTA